MSEDSIIEYSSSIADTEAPEALPAGEYKAIVSSAAVKTSQKGNKYLEVLFLITPDKFPVDYDPGNAPDSGKTIAYRRVQVEDSRRGRYSMKLFCQALNAPTPTTHVDPSEFVNREAQITLANKPDVNGVLREEIEKVTAI